MKKCDICGKTEGKIVKSKKFDKILCNRHYVQLHIYGKIFKRTKYDPNEIIIKEDHAEIILYKNNKEFKRTSIDIEDVEKVKKYKWYCKSDSNCRTDYALTDTKFSKSTIRLHRLVMDVKKDEEIDHRDGNGLNNLKSNLRKCTRAENTRNQRPQSNKKFKYKGVYKNGKNWGSQIRYQGKTIYLGTFKSEVESAKAYDKRAKELFREFAYLNFK